MSSLPMLSSSSISSVPNYRMTTKAGHGTLPFMAPEFFAGRALAQANDHQFVYDASVDIFALGLVFLFMFCYNDSDYGKLYIN